MNPHRYASPLYLVESSNARLFELHHKPGKFVLNWAIWISTPIRKGDLIGIKCDAVTDRYEYCVNDYDYYVVRRCKRPHPNALDQRYFSVFLTKYEGDMFTVFKANPILADFYEACNDPDVNEIVHFLDDDRVVSFMNSKNTICVFGLMTDDRRYLVSLTEFFECMIKQDSVRYVLIDYERLSAPDLGGIPYQESFTEADHLFARLIEYRDENLGAPRQIYVSVHNE